MMGMNPRQMQKMMKQMGVQQQDLPVERVEFFLADRKLVIEPAQVAAVNMMGQKTFQVIGEAVEMPLDDGETAAEISDEDVATVAEQAGVSEEAAREAIEAAEGDLAAAIMSFEK